MTGTESLSFGTQPVTEIASALSLSKQNFRGLTIRNAFLLNYSMTTTSTTSLVPLT